MRVTVNFINFPEYLIFHVVSDNCEFWHHVVYPKHY